jgi:glycosyltransferase involved in cell wall biosynthesis
MSEFIQTKTSTAQLPKLAIFLPDLAGGGAERVCLLLIRGLLRRSYNVDLILAKRRGPLLDELPPGVNVIDLGSVRVKDSIIPLVNYLRRVQPAVLISHLVHCNIVATMAGRYPGVSTKIIITEHNQSKSLWTVSLKEALTFVMRPFVYPFANAAISVSKTVEKSLPFSLGIMRKCIIYNPVIDSVSDGNAFPFRLNLGGASLVTLGRLTPQKNFALLIRAFARVHEQIPIARLTIYGEGAQRGELEALVRSLGLADVVLLPGFLKDVRSTLRAHDLFVSSSLWEGCPLGMIEALASGIRIVTTDYPAALEVLENGRLGRFAKSGNESSLAAAIIEELRHETSTLRDRVSFASSFTVESATDQYLALINEVLAC